jgi:hypothetical protein
MNQKPGLADKVAIMTGVMGGIDEASYCTGRIHLIDGGYTAA